MKTLSAILATVVAVSSLGFALTAAEAAVVPGKPKKPTTSTYECGAELGYLRRVYEEEVAAIEEPWIMAVCDGEDFGLMRNDGNAGALRNELAANDYVMEALDAANFTVDDVIGIRMTGDEEAVIYVHTFHR